MKILKISILVILTLVAMAATQAYEQPRLLQESVRTEAVIKMCSGFSGRKLQALVDAETIKEAEINKQIFQASLSISGNQLIKGLLSDLGAAGSAIPTIVTPLATFIGPSVLGLAILVLIWPFLCCCCCCPSCCPSKCCQKPQNQQYTKCELIWPAATLIIALIITIGATSAGIAKSTTVQNSYRAVGCSLTMALDDILYGNVSNTGKYFMGIGTLVQGLKDMKNNPQRLKTEMNKIRMYNVTGAIAPVYQSGEDLKQLLRKLPTGTTENVTATSWDYDNFADGSSASPTTSSFSTDLGATGPTPSGQLNSSYQTIWQTNKDLQDWGFLAEGLYRTADDLGTQIDPVLNSVSDILKLLQGFANTIASDQPAKYVQYLTIALIVIFALGIVFGMLGLIGVLFATFSQKYGCRKLTYLTCFILFLVALLCFLISLLFSIVSPVIYLACDFLTITISSGAQFSNNVGSLLGSNANLIGACLPGGNGNIFSALNVDVSQITLLQNMINGLTYYNSTNVQVQSQNALNTLSQFIDQYYYTDVLDFTESVRNTFLEKVADPSHASYAACSGQAKFTADSWVPSARLTTITCPSLITHSASSAQCPDSTAIQALVDNDCDGCMDSTKILYNSANVATDLTARYSCATWVTDMTALWDNYYFPKKTNIDPIRNRMQTIQDSFKSPTIGYKDRLGTLTAKFSEAIYSLEQGFPRIFHRLYGVGNGLNCLVIGDDLNLVVNTVCTSLYNSFFGLRLPMVIAGFAILFVLCCSTCSGVRAYKQQVRRGYVGIHPQAENVK